MVLLIPSLLVLAQASGQTPTGAPAGQGPKAPPPRVQDLQTPSPIVLPGPDTASPGVTNAPLSADEAARIALHFQPSLGTAVGNLVTAKGRVVQVKAGQLPQITAAGGYDNLQSLSGYGSQPTQAPSGFLLGPLSPVDAWTGEVYLEQLIFDFNKTRNLVRQSQANEQAALSNLSQAQSDLVYNVKNDFYQYAYAERLVEVNQQNLDNRQRQLDLANSRMGAGIGLPSDVVIAETSKSQAILGLNVARDNAQQAKVNLLTDMGIDPLTPINVGAAEEAPYPMDSPKPLLEIALRRRPEIRAAEQNLVASKYGLSAARAVDLPILFAGLSAGTRGNQFPLSDSTASLELGITVPIYDGGFRAGSIELSKGQVTAAQSQLQTEVLAVKQDVTGAYLELKSAEQRVTIADNEVANAREGVRIAEGRYRTGLGLFQDITTAQQLLLDARTDQEQAEQGRSQARARVRHATGENLDLVSSP